MIKMIRSLCPWACAVLSLLAARTALPTEPARLEFASDDTLEEIRYKIDYNGYAFTVGHNRIFDLTPAEKAAFFARRFPRTPRSRADASDIGPLARCLGRTALPSSFDWRSYDGHSYIGAVRDQGDCGSCYAFGACGAAEGTYNFANSRYDSNRIDFSESYIIWCLGRLSQYTDHFYGCGGSDYDYMELEALTKQGIVLESAFPYRESDPGSCAHWSDHTYAFQSWHRITCNDTDAIKTAIMTYGVVDAAVYANSAFQAYDSGVYQDTSTSCSYSPCYYTPTNHAISLVGWDDSPPEGGGGVWILRNSWGDTWGESGYMRIRYGSARSSCEVCYLVCAPSAPTPTPPPSPTPAPSRSPTPVRTPTPSPKPSPSPSPTAARTPSPPPTPSPTPPPPTPAPSLTPTAAPSATFPPATPTPAPTLSPPAPSPSPALTASPPPSPTPTCGPSLPPERAAVQSGDYDGDGTDDIAIFRPSSGLWSARNITSACFGASADRPVAGDFNGDGRTEIAVFRPASGLWSVRDLTRFAYGTAGDIPAPEDYDGDGSAEAGVFRESTGQWFVYGLTRLNYGTAGDWPAPGDYAGDGTGRPAVYRSSLGAWYVYGLTRLCFGAAADRPAAGDFRGDGIFRPAVFRPCTGLWALRDVSRVFLGNCLDYTVPADFDGDGTDDPAVFRPSLGYWSLRGITAAYFGSPGDIPVTR